MSLSVFNISRCSLHDGDGIRTVVYMKGCPLSCLWCHNPEGLRTEPEVLFHEKKCVGCGRCAAVCPDCHEIADGRLIYSRDHCTGCMRCADICPAEALVRCGILYTRDELLKILLKDKKYYVSSKGGVTFSGGECMMQTSDLKPMLEICQKNGINTAIETSFYTVQEKIASIIPFTDTFLVDIKHTDSVKHRRYTGVPCEFIHENLRFAAEKHSDVRIRVPLIPSFNDDEENLTKTAKLALSCKNIKSIELLKYNNFADSKYGALGMKYTSFADRTQTNDEMERMCRRINFIAGKDIAFYKK